MPATNLRGPRSRPFDGEGQPGLRRLHAGLVPGQGEQHGAPPGQLGLAARGLLVQGCEGAGDPTLQGGCGRTEYLLGLLLSLLRGVFTDILLVGIGDRKSVV